MELRLTFSASVIIEGADIDDIRIKYDSMSLFSDEAVQCEAEYNGLLMAEDEDNRDFTFEFEN